MAACPRSATASAPCSANSAARSAELSRTTLLTRCFLASLVDQLIDDAPTWLLESAEELLGPLQGLPERLDADASGVLPNDQFLPRGDAEPGPDVSRDHYPASRINL